MTSKKPQEYGCKGGIELALARARNEEEAKKILAEMTKGLKASIKESKKEIKKLKKDGL
jgi:hypothetical protein